MAFKTFGRVIVGKNLMDDCHVCAQSMRKGWLYPVLKKHETRNEVLIPGSHRVWETIDYLACSVCGAMFHARLAGTDVEKHLLEQLKTFVTSEGEAPKHCPRHGGKEALLEFEHFIPGPSQHLRRHRVQGMICKLLYCPGCLTVAHVIREEVNPSPSSSPTGGS